MATIQKTAVVASRPVKSCETSVHDTDVAAALAAFLADDEAIYALPPRRDDEARAALRREGRRPLRPRGPQRLPPRRCEAARLPRCGR